MYDNTYGIRTFHPLRHQQQEYFPTLHDITSCSTRHSTMNSAYARFQYPNHHSSWVPKRFPRRLEQGFQFLPFVLEATWKKLVFIIKMTGHSVLVVISQVPWFLGGSLCRQLLLPAQTLRITDTIRGRFGHGRLHLMLCSKISPNKSTEFQNTWLIHSELSSYLVIPTCKKY